MLRPLLRISDYIFYRVAVYYKLHRKISDPEVYGALIVWIIQFSTLVGIIVWILLLAGKQYESLGKRLSYFVIFTLFVFDGYRYLFSVRISDLDALWGGEDRATRLRNRRLITIYAIAVVLLGLTHGVLRYNFKLF